MKKYSTDSTDLNSIGSFDSEVYENIDLNRLTIYGISVLQEKKIPVTFETLVVILFRMFPNKFSLVGFEEYPDAARVNRALLQLRPKYRNWALGNVKLGYSITERGKAEVERTRILLEKPYLQKHPKRVLRKRTLSIDEEISRIEDSKIYRLYKDAKYDELYERDVWNFLRAFPYTPKKALREYMNKLKGSAEYNKRPDIVEFLKWVEKKFAEIFRDVRYSRSNQKQSR